MKRRELTTTVVKLNWKYIIDHATDRKFWEQKFKVYDIDRFEVFMEIYEIDISYKKIYSKAEIDKYKEIMASGNKINFAKEYKDIENKLEEVKSERFEDYMKDKLEEL